MRNDGLTWLVILISLFILGVNAYLERPTDAQLSAEPKTRTAHFLSEPGAIVGSPIRDGAPTARQARELGRASN